MSGSPEAPWSENSNTPKIQYSLYFGEKVYVAGFLIGAVLYGIVIALFFECMTALLDLVNRARGGIKWGLVAHTVAMFSIVTIYTAITLDIQSTSFIDNREFPGSSTDSAIPPGPIGYQFFLHSKAVGLTPTPLAVLNNWLSDGLLLYRCYIVYSMNYWIIILPCLMYLACLATGIMFCYQTTRPADIFSTFSATVHFGVPYFSISFALNALLTVMIVTRLILQRKNLRNIIGTTSGVGGLYKAAATILVESSALYAISFMLWVEAWARGSFTFSQMLGQAQVIAPFLITLRIANRRAPTGRVVVSRNLSAICFRGQQTPSGGSGTLAGDTSSRDDKELGVEIEVTIDVDHGGTGF